MGGPTPRWWKILDAISQLLNVSWPFWSVESTNANESTSGRCYREDRKFRHVIDWVFFTLGGEVEHCKNSYYADIDRAWITTMLDDRDTPQERPK